MEGFSALKVGSFSGFLGSGSFNSRSHTHPGLQSLPRETLALGSRTPRPVFRFPMRYSDMSLPRRGCQATRLLCRSQAGPFHRGGDGGAIPQEAARAAQHRAGSRAQEVRLPGQCWLRESLHEAPHHFCALVGASTSRVNPVCSGSQRQAPAYAISSIPPPSQGVSVATRGPIPNPPFSRLCHSARVPFCL